jgi:hypothetical protein
MSTIEMRRNSVVIRLSVAGAPGPRPGDMHALLRALGVLPQGYKEAA